MFRVNALILMGQMGLSGRRGARRDTQHRASVATHPKGPVAPPKAGCFCAVAALRIFADASASPCEARLTTAQIHPVKMTAFTRNML
jgi:hypothetical protein